MRNLTSTVRRMRCFIDQKLSGPASQLTSSLGRDVVQMVSRIKTNGSHRKCLANWDKRTLLRTKDLVWKSMSTIGTLWPLTFAAVVRDRIQKKTRFMWWSGTKWRRLSMMIRSQQIILRMMKKRFWKSWTQHLKSLSSDTNPFPTEAASIDCDAFTEPLSSRPGMMKEKLESTTFHKPSRSLTLKLLRK